MNIWKNRNYNTIMYILYELAAAWFFWMQNRKSMLGEYGIGNFQDLMTVLTVGEPEFVHIIFALPLWLSILMLTKEEYRIQTVIRKKSRKQILGDSLLRTVSTALQISLFQIVLILAGTVIFHINADNGKEVSYILHLAFFFIEYFMADAILLLAAEWITGRKILSLILVLAVSLVSIKTGISYLNLILAVCGICAGFLTAERKEFFNETW